LQTALFSAQVTASLKLALNGVIVHAVLYVPFGGQNHFQRAILINHVADATFKAYFGTCTAWCVSVKTAPDCWTKTAKAKSQHFSWVHWYNL